MLNLFLNGLITIYNIFLFLFLIRYDLTADEFSVRPVEFAISGYNDLSSIKEFVKESVVYQ